MKKTMYPCQYPDCPALYDETQDGRIDGMGAMLTGWLFPPGTQVSTAMIRSHEHILNIMHKVERNTDIHDMDESEGTGCAGLTTEPGSPELKEQ